MDSKEALGIFYDNYRSIRKIVSRGMCQKVKVVYLVNDIIEFTWEWQDMSSWSRDYYRCISYVKVYPDNTFRIVTHDELSEGTIEEQQLLSLYQNQMIEKDRLILKLRKEVEFYANQCKEVKEEILLNSLNRIQ